MLDFPDLELPEQTGETNICWDFCLQFLGRPWATIKGCGPSPEAAADSVAAIVAKLNQQVQAMGYPANSVSFSSGACPS